MNIPSNQGVTGTPYEVNVTPVQDNVDEVPEYLKVTFDLVTVTCARPLTSKKALKGLPRSFARLLRHHREVRVEARGHFVHLEHPFPDIRR